LREQTDRQTDRQTVGMSQEHGNAGLQENGWTEST